MTRAQQDLTPVALCLIQNNYCTVEKFDHNRIANQNTVQGQDPDSQPGSQMVGLCSGHIESVQDLERFKFYVKI